MVARSVETPAATILTNTHAIIRYVMPSEHQQSAIDSLLGEARLALLDRDWPRAREVAQQALGIDPDSADAKSFMAAAHGGFGDEAGEAADALARSVHGAREGLALARRITTQPKAPLEYPPPDRSDFTPNRQKSDENDAIDIGWAEGTFSDGRPFRVECWAADQITSLTVFTSTLDLEDASDDDLRDFLVEEGLLVFVADYRHVSGAKFLDPSNNEMWSINVVIGTEDGILTECTAELAPYPRGVGVAAEQRETTPAAAPDFSELDYQGGPPGLKDAIGEFLELHDATGKPIRPLDDIETAVRKVVGIARADWTPLGRFMVAQLMVTLGDDLQRLGSPIADVEEHYRMAVVLGRESNSREGWVTAARGLTKLASALERDGRPIADVEPNYREAAAVGREAGTPEGLEAAALALSALGLAIARAQEPIKDALVVFKEAADLGRESGTPRGMDLAERRGKPLDFSE